jgi:uncharacterized protein DUF3667
MNTSVKDERVELTAESAAVHEGRCLNCSSILHGPYCAACGQRDVPPHPSMRELVGEAIAEFWGWDGRFFQTFVTLFTRPGDLTAQVASGRRVRFISPIRLYLVASLVYFAANTAAPPVRNKDGQVLYTGVHVSTVRTEPGGNSSTPLTGSLSAEDRAKIAAELPQASPFMRPVLQRAYEDADAYNRDFQKSIPRAFFVLVPAFALVLSLFFRGRRYPEHLFFALHLQAFLFLVSTIPELLKFTKSMPVVVGATIGVVVAISVYTVLALRRTYGTSLAGTITRALGVVSVYLPFYGATMFALLYWAAVHP